MEHKLVGECRNIGAIWNDPTALQRLGRRTSKAIAAGEIDGERIRIAVLSSFLLDMLIEALPAFLLARGIVAELVAAPYGAIAVDLLAQNSVTNNCDLALILPTYRDLAFVPAIVASTDEAQAAVDREVAAWIALWQRVAKPVLQLTFDPPPFRQLSEADGFRPGGLLRHVRRVNQTLVDQAPARVAFIDAEALVCRVGEKWHDARTYFLCKQPFAPLVGSDLADAVAAGVSGIFGKARKVLVLDLDNTLWGGVLGDVGIEGLVLGKETAEGEAFVAFQTYCKLLAERGVILAVCSKNAEEIAREPFRTHSGMVLRESDIACFVANFNDKATNLRHIAQSLNVGLDSLVFVDDSQIERAWVKRELPEVLVVDLPDDPALYCDAVENARAFPMYALTAEDVGRNSSYRSRALISDAQSSAVDMEQFLESLRSVAVVERVDATTVERIVQLISKTNQFKLTPRLFDAAEVLSNASNVIAVRLRDNMQDYGITAVAITKIEKEELVILNWVMSCRVFSRRLENFMLELLRSRAAAHSLNSVRADFVQSKKNGVARDILIGLGFVQDEDGSFLVGTKPESPPTAHYMHFEHT